MTRASERARRDRRRGRPWSLRFVVTFSLFQLAIAVIRGRVSGVTDLTPYNVGLYAGFLALGCAVATSRRQVAVGTSR